MVPWVMCHRLNLQESRWQNSRKNHLMIDPKMGARSTDYGSNIRSVTLIAGRSHTGGTMKITKTVGTFVVLAVSVLLLVSLFSGCTRSASNAPSQTPPAQGETPVAPREESAGRYSRYAGIR